MKILIGCFLLLTLQVQAQLPLPIRLDQISEVKNIARQVVFLRDDTHQLSFKQILSKEVQQKFQPNRQTILNLGLGNSSIWIKFTVQTSIRTSPYLLELGNAEIDQATLYCESMGQLLKKTTLGDHLNYQKRDFKTNHFLYELTNLSPGQTYTYYLHCVTNGTLKYPLTLGPFKAFLEKNHREDLIIGIYFGWMFIMIFYNLFIWITTKETSYLWYVTYLIPTLLFTASWRGYALEFLWPAQVSLNNYITSMAALTSLAALIFSNSFLNTSRFAPLVRKVSYLVFIPFSAVVVGTNLAGYNATSVQALQFLALSNIFLYLMGFVVLRKGYKPARLYLLGWGVIFIAIIHSTLSNFNLLPKNALTEYMIELGTSLEVLLFSLALADKITFYRREKEVAQKEVLKALEVNKKIVEDQNEILEQKVVAKTQELTAANQVLLQNEGEISAQRDALKEQNQALSQYQKRIGQSFQLAQIIQQAFLPTNELIQQIFSEHFIIYRPKDVVSGDFYWLCPKQDHIILVAADCTGHGVPGAFITLIGKNLLDKIIKIDQVTNPGSILNQLHQEIQVAFRQEKGKGNNEGMDASVISIQKLPDTPHRMRVWFAGAKNSLLYLNQDQKKIHELKATRKSIGGYINDRVLFETQVLTLPVDTTLYLGSDGLSDQNNVTRRSFGKARVKAFHENHAHLSLPDQGTLLEETLQAFMKGTEQRDDILWMGLRV